MEFSKIQLVDLSLGWNVIEESVTISPDNRHVAFVAAENGRYMVSVDGVRGTLYEGILRGMYFSADSQRFAFVAVEGERKQVVLDGEEQTQYDDLGNLHFSPDSQHFAYWARLGEKEFIVLDGIEQKHYGLIVKNTLTFSPDSREIAYGASNETENEHWAGLGSFFAVVGSQEGKSYGGIGPSALWTQEGGQTFLAEGPTYSPDGKRLGYIALELNGFGMHAIVDGEPGERYTPVINFLFSPNSAHYAFIAGSRQVVMDGVEGPEFEKVLLGTLQFSPDGERLAYIATDGEKEFVVVDGEPGKAYDRIGPGSVRFSPDSQRLLYVGIRGDQEILVTDEIEGPLQLNIVIDTGTFSPDSQHVAYAMTIGSGSAAKDYVVVDGKRVEIAYEFIAEEPLAFSPDSRHMAFLIRKGDAWALVIDHVLVAEHIFIFTGDSGSLIWDSNTEFHYLVVDDGGIYLVEGELAPAQ